MKKSGKVSVDVMSNIATQINTLSDDIAQLKLQAISDLGLIADNLTAINVRLSDVESASKPIIFEPKSVSQGLLDALKYANTNTSSKPTATAAQIAYENTPKYNIAKERMLKTYEAVKYALRMMKDINYSLSETCFVVDVTRHNYTRRFTVNSYNSRELFVDIRYNDVNGQARSAGYNTLAMATADITAVIMYYATR